MKNILYLCCAFVSHQVHAQSMGPSTLNSAGQATVVNGNTYEWAIGEPIIHTATTANLVVTQGVLQPFNTSDTLKLNNPNIISNLKVYPNPVREGWLYISPAFNQGGSLKYILTDALGRVMASQQFTLTIGNEIQRIGMHLLANGQYNLTLEWKDKNGTAFNNYKIQKIK
jgi:hypothetical protein